MQASSNYIAGQSGFFNRRYSRIKTQEEELLLLRQQKKLIGTHESTNNQNSSTGSQSFVYTEKLGNLSEPRHIRLDDENNSDLAFSNNNRKFIYSSSANHSKTYPQRYLVDHSDFGPSHYCYYCLAHRSVSAPNPSTNSYIQEPQAYRASAETRQLSQLPANYLCFKSTDRRGRPIYLYGQADPAVGTTRTSITAMAPADTLKYPDGEPFIERIPHEALQQRYAQQQSQSQPQMGPRKERSRSRGASAKRASGSAATIVGGPHSAHHHHHAASQASRHSAPELGDDDILLSKPSPAANILMSAPPFGPASGTRATAPVATFEMGTYANIEPSNTNSSSSANNGAISLSATGTNNDTTHTNPTARTHIMMPKAPHAFVERPVKQSRRRPKAPTNDVTWTSLFNTGLKFFRGLSSPPYDSRSKELSMPSPHIPKGKQETREKAPSAPLASSSSSSSSPIIDVTYIFGNPPPNHFPWTWNEALDWFIYFIRMTPIFRDVLWYLEWLSESEYKAFTGIAVVISVILLMMTLHYAMILLESLFAVIRLFCLPAVILGKLIVSL